MPRRSSAHITGDIARDSVALLFTSMGHAVEKVFQDYGDDLVVQTILNGEIEPIRIYVQVKGTQRMASYQLQSERNA
jgi:hypothetical protein